jgi:hypothetical protein
MSINLVQWEGSTVTPKLDAIMYDDGSYGIIKGCAITHQGTNLLKIANGFIKIAGRLIEIAEETIQCQVSASGTVNGQLWIRLDLSSVTPAVFMTEAAAVLTPLTQNADCNFQNGIYELQLATYNIDESVITNLVETAPELERLRTALENIDLAANKVTYDNTHSGLSANKVQGAIDEINDNLTANNQSFRYGYENGEYGYYTREGGADTFHPFRRKTVLSKQIPITQNGAWSVTIDITGDYPDYSNLTIDDIFVVLDQISHSNAPNGKYNLTYSYSNGIITITTSDIRIPFRYPTGSSTLNCRVVIC